MGPQSGKWFWKLLGLGIAFVSKETKKLLGIAKTTIRSLSPNHAVLGPAWLQGSKFFDQGILYA